MPVGKVGEHQTSRRRVVVPWPEMGVQGPNGRTEQRPGFLTDITFMQFLIPFHTFISLYKSRIRVIFADEAI